jgi:hypothetical protein
MYVGGGVGKIPFIVISFSIFKMSGEWNETSILPKLFPSVSGTISPTVH